MFKERVVSWANGLTLLRLIATVTFLTAAIYLGSTDMLLIGLVASWLADTADGFVARRGGCETVLGAQFDAAADRVTVLFIAIGSVVLASWAPETIVIAGVVWLQYGVVDQILFPQFLRFDLWTPDEFHEVDPWVWLVNWSQIAKIASGAPTAALALGGAFAYGGAMVALALIGLRLACYVTIADRCAAAARTD